MNTDTVLRTIFYVLAIIVMVIWLWRQATPAT